jgi:hypothetical protein
VPALQLGVAPPHTWPQVPQLPALVLVLTSQPSSCLLLLQSANPALQTPAWHDEDEHARVMFALEQLRPQAPQLLTSLAKLTSQPSVRRLPLQSPNPFAQAPTQLPVEHAGAGTWLDEHTAPHEPQLIGSVAVLTSHPSDRRLLLQSVNPATQAPVHTPAVQVAWMLFDEQAAPQPPQELTDVEVFVSHPSSRLLALQSLKPALQFPDSQEPPAQTRSMFVVEHAAPHDPQLVTSTARF